MGIASMYGLLYFIRPWLESNFSVYLPIEALSRTEWIYLAAIFCTGTLAGFIPAIKAYRNSLQDGLTVKL
jgi:putative ABC transport system permease protein